MFLFHILYKNGILSQYEINIFILLENMHVQQTVLNFPKGKLQFWVGIDIFLEKKSV